MREGGFRKVTTIPWLLLEGKVGEVGVVMTPYTMGEQTVKTHFSHFSFPFALLKGNWLWGEENLLQKKIHHQPNLYLYTFFFE